MHSGENPAPGDPDRIFTCPATREICITGDQLDAGMRPPCGLGPVMLKGVSRTGDTHMIDACLRPIPSPIRPLVAGVMRFGEKFGVELTVRMHEE